MKNTIKLLPLLIVFTTILFISWNTDDPEPVSILDKALDIEKKIKMVNSSDFTDVNSLIKIDQIPIRNRKNPINIGTNTLAFGTSGFIFSRVLKLAGVDFVVL